MNKLDRYLTTLFLSRWASTTLAMLALLSVVDSIGNADVLPDGAGLAGTLKYAWLRLPAQFDRIFMFALFISMLLTFLSLIRRQELVSFGAAGVSPLRQIRALAPCVLLITFLSAYATDLTLPPSARAIDNWLGGRALTDNEFNQDIGLWIAEETAFIEIGKVRGNELFDLKLYERASDTTIQSITNAKSAYYNGNTWILNGVSGQSLSDDNPRLLSEWKTTQTPNTLQKLSTSPRFLSIWDQYELSWLLKSGTRPASAYIVWSLNRLTMPLVALGFLIIATTIMQAHGRRQTGDIRLIYGLGIGFGFFIIDGVLKTLAEGGGVSVAMAIGFPLFILFGLGVYLLLEAEQA